MKKNIKNFIQMMMEYLGLERMLEALYFKHGAMATVLIVLTSHSSQLA